MVRISEELVRKRAEHNDGEIFSLEELSLHQSYIEKIEHLDKWCRELKILYLQANLISKIENVSKLKKLEYLNLAMNNITRIENLEGCESLMKLDLTLNFIEELSSVRQLASNYNLTELFLMGNPCATYEGYREYVLATLPQLISLDGQIIKHSERILAKNNFEKVAMAIELLEAKNEVRDVMVDDRTADDDAAFWTKPTDHSPESRWKMYEMMRKAAEEKTTSKLSTSGFPSAKKDRSLIAKDGRVLNINEPKVDFKFTDDDLVNGFLKLDVAVFKYLDTSLVEVNLEPNYVQIKIKGKMLQLVFPCEIKVEQSKVERSITTGHLLLTMPKYSEFSYNAVEAFLKNLRLIENRAMEKSIGYGMHGVNVP